MTRVGVPVAVEELLTGLDRTMSKQSLVALSHAIERSRYAGPDPSGPPALVLSCFQRSEYFEPETARYATLAAGGAVVVAAFVGVPAAVPAGVTVVDLPPGHPLAEVWSVLVLDDEIGITLVGRDRSRLVEAGHTLEQRRSFAARFSFRREDTAREASRLLGLVTDRLPPEVARAARAIVTRSAAAPVSQAEVRLGSAAGFLVQSVEEAHGRAAQASARLANCRVGAEADELTGLHNRRYLQRFLESAPAAGVMPLSFLLIDVDSLKSVNDRLGHAAGDAVLRAVAAAIRASSRPGDALVRWGGDEFVVLLPGVDERTAHRIAERLVSAVQSSTLDEPWADQPMSVSIGVSAANTRQLPIEALDAALYAAKAARPARSA